MKYLIRFEDTYSMADLFCKAYNINYSDSIDLNITRVHDDLYIQKGLGAVAITRICTREVKDIQRLSPDIVLTIFDLDSTATHNVGPMSREEICDNMEFTETSIEALNCKFLWLPIQWCAETVILRSWLQNAEKLVNSQTWRYQTVLLAMILRVSPAIKAKIVRSYVDNIDIDILLQCSSLNNLLTDYTLCGYDRDRAIEIVSEYYNSYYEYLNNVTYFTIDGIQLSNHDSLYANKSRFEYFPKTYK